MRILQVGKYYPPYRGGMETVLENLVQGLLDHGSEVHTLVSGQENLARQSEVSGPRSGQPGKLVRAGRWGTFFSQPLNPGLWGLLRRELVDFKPDLVHLHLPNPLAVITWQFLALDPGIPRPTLAIWHHADITRQKLGARLVRPWVQACYRRCAGISVSTRSLAADSGSLGPFQSKIEVIPFGISSEPWGSIKARHDGDFLFVGRLVPYKGVGTLLKAMVRVPAARLSVVGEGPLRQNLQDQIQELGLGSRVTLQGNRSPAQLGELMARARALVLPSIDQSETFGLVQLEAMASGVPVIASNLSTGVAEVGQEGQTCLLVPPGDEQALASVLEKFQSDGALCRRLGENSRQRYQSRYTRQNMTGHLVRWYQKLLAKEQGRGKS